ncbi:MAG: glutathione S-transferase [Henriciella sp.]
MAIAVAHVKCDLREVVLRDKPQHMLEVSPKGTVPVILEPDGRVIEESLEIMHWALGQSDPENWLVPEIGSLEQMMALIAECDGPFKHALDRYKYPDRYEDINAEDQRALGLKFLQRLDHHLGKATYLFGSRESLADNAIFPFIRQFANTDRAWFDALALPNLQLWLSHFLESKRFQSIMRKYPQWKSGESEPIFPPQS